MIQTAANITPLPPALRVQLTGQYLIEASAGTGKTWTLTGIMLRLLIEARRAPEQIIATTFTRAAAAEMRQRVHERLVNFYQLLQWLDKLQSDPESKNKLYPDALLVIPDEKTSVNKLAKESASQRQGHLKQDDNLLGNDDTALNNPADKKLSRADLDILNKERDTWLIEQAELFRYDEMVQDPINLHLITYLLNNVHSYPLAEAIRRTALVLTTLDRLFIGTLDSLAQKWLAEYSSETGHQQRMAIIEDAEIKLVTQSIVHDELRQFQSRLYHQQPKIYDLLEQQGKLTAVEDHQASVDKSLQFVSAPIDDLDMPPAFDFAAFETLLKKFAELDLADIEPYFDASFRKSQGFRGGNSILNTKITSVIEIKDSVVKYGIDFYRYISDDATKLLVTLKEAEFPDEDGKLKGFNKNKEPFHKTFFELQTINTLLAIYDTVEALNRYLDAILAQLNRHVALSVRQKLPLILEDRGETTFTLQMVRLNQALTGQQGDKLARYIRHHYPVALIDESQDINGEQASMIEQIYLAKSRLQNPPTSNINEDKGFLLLVGDPKQAIYGFRGGDVANYNHMKNRFNSKAIMTLNVNRRSNARLIDALNNWFGTPDASVKNELLSELGDNIHYQHITAVKDNAKLSWLSGTGLDADNKGKTVANDAVATSLDTISQLLPDAPVSLIHLPYDKEAKYDAFETTALHIAALLKSGQTLDGKPIQPSDIGVLGRKGTQLKQVEDMLIKLNVPTLATSVVSIFETAIAADIAALMAAMLHPYRRDMINRVLTSQLYGLTLAEVKAMMISHDTGVADGDGNHSTSHSAISDASSNTTAQNQPQESYQDFITTLKKGALQWQNWGILSALNFLFATTDIRPQGVWQALASLPEGERQIMDLRQVMDILAQYSSGMGEHELLAWFRQNMDTASTSDWAKQHPLPTESGVQLMTIHKAKGLEFPIVYVLGMDNASRAAGKSETFGMYLYNAGLPSSNQAPNQASLHGSHNIASQTQRRLSPVQGTLTDANYFINQVTQEDFAESKRLAYVAFTRASEQLYIVAKDAYDTRDITLKPLFHWLDTSKAMLELPDRLMPKIGWLSGLYVGEFYDIHKQRLLNSVNKTKPNTQTIEITYPPLSDVIPTTYFTGWAKTSFTALARQLDESSQAIAVIDERVDDDISIDTEYNDATSTVSVSSALSGADNLSQHKLQHEMADNIIDVANLLMLKPDTDIRFSFVRGANAGTFLHDIFEKIDFDDDVNSTQWSVVIDRAISSYQLPMMYASSTLQARLLTDDKSVVDAKNNQNSGKNEANEAGIDDSKHQALKNWIDEVLHTPLLASGKPLKAIAPKKRFAELGFNMGLSENFKPQDINHLFKTYLPDDPDKHINLKTQDSTHLYRYLRGEIDLVYEHDDKYYVVDYKSNHLGNSLSSYDQTTLNTAMNKAGYWLQAAIYQVALHRFLSMRIPDYLGNETKYLGAVEYIFLRGTYDSSIAYHDSESSQWMKQSQESRGVGVELDAGGSYERTYGRTYGLVIWDIPIDFLKALDALFGKPDDPRY